MFFGITSSADWESTEPVSKGWSSDRKYRIRTRSGQELLLRLSDASQYDSNHAQIRKDRDLHVDAARIRRMQ